MRSPKRSIAAIQSVQKVLSTAIIDTGEEDVSNANGIKLFISYCQEFQLLVCNIYSSISELTRWYQPLPIVIRRIEEGSPSTKLDLARRGIGDKHCIPLAMCLEVSREKERERESELPFH